MPLILITVASELECIPAAFGREADKQFFTLTFTPVGNLESSVNLTTGGERCCQAEEVLPGVFFWACGTPETTDGYQQAKSNSALVVTED